MKFKKTLIASAICTLTAGVSTHAIAGNYDDAGTDYSTAQTHQHIWTPGVEALETVNNILCFVEQLKTSEMVNRGLYTALVDEKKCDTGSSGNDRDKGPAQQFVIVEAVRADDNAPQYAKVWIPGMNFGDDVTGTVKAFASMSQEPTENDPLQDFTLRFDMYDNSNNKVGGGQIVATPSSELENGKIGIKFYESMETQEGTRVSAANIIKNPDGTDGVAITSYPDWSENQNQVVQKAFGLSWNEQTVNDRVLIKKGNGSVNNNSDLQGGDEICLAKDELTTAVWRYGLYYKNDVTIDGNSHSAGDEVEVNSGFPIVFTENGTEKNGFLGYWGLWTEGDATPTGTIYKVDYSQERPERTAITMNQAPGKLWKNNLQEKTLADIDGVKFEYWGNDGAIEAEYQADGNDGAGFYQTGTIEHGENGPEVTATTATLINLDNVGDKLYLWSQQLGGQVTVPVRDENNDPIAQENMKVFVAVRSLVSPSDELFTSSAVDLKCYDRCPKANITLSDAETWDGPFNGQSITYNISNTDMTLTRGGNDVAFVDGISREALQQTPNNWGVQSGMLLDAEAAAIADADNSALHDGSITTWYEWETGLEHWNKYTIVKQGNDVITFDEPLKLNLTFDEAAARKNKSGNVPNRYSAYLNQTFLLEYGGNGDLWGIPSKNVDDGRFYPAIAMANGAEATDGARQDDSDNAIEYVVKAWDIEKKMRAKTDNSCSGLVLGDVPGGLPSEIDSTLPINNEEPPQESLLPDTPSVINGVVQVDLN